MDRRISSRRASLFATALACGIAAAADAEEIVVALPDAAAAAHEAPPKTLTLRIEDVQGSYTIPFIQSSRSLRVRIGFTDPAVAAAELQLMRGDEAASRRLVARDKPSVSFANLAPGEYTLLCRGLDGGRRERCRMAYNRIGVGAVIAALGDSITEGYFSRGFKRDDLNLTADRFPAESVSKDGRNFPQFSPTAAHHLPSVNCFESWLTRLNDKLAGVWREPVFIANEGWGGITTGGYLNMMRNDAGWKTRMRRLEPQIWLIHLGVNDERAHVSAAQVRGNLAAMLDILSRDYQAQPAHVFLCRPSYDYAAGAAAILRSYAAEMDALIAERGLSRGPDFFAAFARDRKRWYGGDPVHPNLEGMARMADLWQEAIVKQLPSGL